MNNVLVLTARRGTGKDYLTQCLIDAYPPCFGKYKKVQRLSFSDELRVLAHELFPWCPLDPDYQDKDIPVQHPDNVMGLSPRDVWKRLADDNDPSLRRIDPKILVNRFKARNIPVIEANPDTLFVITDLRTEVEDDFVNENGWYKLRIENPNPPKSLDEFENKIYTYRVDDIWVHHKNGDNGFTKFIGKLLV